jgi:group I intron endonuclease
MKSGIYLIKNIANNKVYVGSAINIDKRWSLHKRELKEGNHHSCLLQRAWDKYGEQSFKFEILEEVANPQHLLAYEQVYLDYYKSYEDDKGYNICKVAGSPLGIKHTEEAKQNMKKAKQNISEETRQKLREIHTGLKRSEETKQKMREAAKNIREETRQKLREAQTGKKHSQETKQKLKEARTGRKLSQETKQKLREINIGKKLSDEHKQKLRESKIGLKHSQETRQKLREAQTGKKLSEETKKKMSEAHRKNKNNKYYSFNKDKKKYIVKIWGKFIGWYNTEEEAKQAVIINLEKLKAQQIVSP